MKGERTKEQHEKHAAEQRRRTAKLKAEGRCISCGVKLDTEFVSCTKCLRRAKDYQQMRRDINRDCGLTARGDPIEPDEL